METPPLSPIVPRPYGRPSTADKADQCDEVAAMVAGGHLRSKGDEVGRTPEDWAADLWSEESTDAPEVQEDEEEAPKKEATT